MVRDHALDRRPIGKRECWHHGVSSSFSARAAGARRLTLLAGAAGAFYCSRGRSLRSRVIRASFDEARGSMSNTATRARARCGGRCLTLLAMGAGAAGEFPQRLLRLLDVGEREAA